MKLFFKLFLLLLSLSSFSNQIFLFEFTDKESHVYKFIQKEMNEKYEFPSKFETWKQVSKCSSPNKNTIAHFCLEKNKMRVLFLNEDQLKKVTQGYIN